jgi:TonB family protein
MRYIAALITVFALAAATVSTQEKQSPDQVKDPQFVAANKKPKNEVELMLENARKSGETIIHACLEDCEENPEANAVENEDFAKGRIVRLPKPPYPPIARLANVSGVVIVQVIIDLDGSIIAAGVSSGHPLLNAPCLQAARESLFTTSTLDGKPVKVTGVIRYTFTLPRTSETQPFP